MEFHFRPEDEAFRDELRAFLQRELPAGWQETWHGPLGHMLEEDRAVDLAMRGKLARQGWLTLAWPREYGGGGADVLRQMVFNEEMEYQRAPGRDPQGINMVGPSVIAHGTEAQKQDHLPRIAHGESLWTQGFSEPNAGSDLASLETRAVRDGDGYVISGRKVWTTRAHYATWMHLLARTDPAAPKHKGISYFLVDMQSAGIEVRPLWDMTGEHSFNEVLLHDMRVPRAALLGQENQGWYIATGTLDMERSGVIFSAYFRRLLEDAQRHLASAPHTGRSPLRDPLIRHALADLAVAVHASRMLSYRVGWMQHRRMPASTLASTSKLFSTELFQRIARTLLRMLGQHGALAHGDPRAPMQGGLAWLYLFTLSRTISAGTSEVQRNIIATRGLGLPR